jgi:hypothetical protein
MGTWPIMTSMARLATVVFFVIVASMMEAASLSASWAL